MSLDPRVRTTGHGQQSARSWSACPSPARGTSDERQAATSGGATTATTHNNSSALFSGAALLLGAATRAGAGEISVPSNHGLVVDPMPTTHIITSKEQEAMTRKAKVMSESAHQDGDGVLVVGNAGDPSNKSSSNANGRLYATVHPGFWRMEGKGTANILVRIRMKDATKNPSISANANTNANANANPQLYATLPPGFWKTEGNKMTTTSTKVRVKIRTKDATKKLLAPSKKKATGIEATNKAKKKDKDLPAGVRRKDDKYMVSVCLPGIGGSRSIATFATKATATEALGYANAKVQDIRLELGGQKLETKQERDAKLSEVKAHVMESITNKMLVGNTPPPSATVINSAATKLDRMGTNPTCISEIPHNHRSPTKSTPSTLSTRLPAKKRANQVLHDMSAEEALERANQGPPNADCGRSKKPKADEKSLPLKKRRLIVFEESPQKQNQEDVQEQVDKYRHQQEHQQKQQKEGHIQPAVKEGAEANNWTRPSPQLSAPSQSFMTDQAMKLRSTLNELISNGVIEWRPSGLSFMIKKPDFLRASDFTSLSAWGFDQIRGGDDLGAIIHPNYRRDQPTLPLLPIRRSAKTNYCLSIAQDRYGSGMFLDVVIPRRSVSNPSSSFGIDLTCDADGWTRVYTRTGQHGWLRDGDIIHAVNGEKMFLPNSRSLLFTPTHQQKPMLHAIVVMACRRTPPGMPLTLRLFRENKSALSTSI